MVSCWLNRHTFISELNDVLQPKIIRLIFIALASFTDAFIYGSINKKDYYGIDVKNKLHVVTTGLVRLTPTAVDYANLKSSCSVPFGTI